MKKFLIRVFFLIVLQGLVNLTAFASHAADFLDRKNPHNTPLLGWDTKIPVGFVGRTAHHIILPMDTPVSTIPLKISQKREEIGLPPDISSDEQNDFFQELPWETAKAVLIKSPSPGRIVRVNVQPGQQVMMGDVICTIECMKMEHTIRAISHGKIRDILFQAGDMVDNASNLIGLLPASPDWEDIDQDKILENKDFLISLFPWTTKAASKSTKPFPSNREWGNMHQPRILDGKDYLVFLYPWIAGASPTSLNVPLPHNGTKIDLLNVFSGNENNQQVLKSLEVRPSGIQNSIIYYPDQDHKISMNSTQTAFEIAEKQPFIWQGSKASFQEQKIGSCEFKDTSGISIVAWVHWFCGLAVLGKFAFALKSLSCNLLRGVRLKKYSFIVSAFPRTAYLYTGDCNKYLNIRNKNAHNRNRRYLVRWKVAS